MTELDKLIAAVEAGEYSRKGLGPPKYGKLYNDLLAAIGPSSYEAFLLSLKTHRGDIVSLIRAHRATITGADR